VAPARRAHRWTALADTILADAERDAVHPSGRWRRAPDDDGLDASLLLPALRGAFPADDKRHLATLDALLDELTEDHFVYRFRHDDRPLGEAEGAFVMCGFVVALAEHQRGRTASAHRWFERNRAACGPSGLFSEEYDIAQRQMRGNIPQAFVHALMLEAAARLAGPWADPPPGR
jgi:GH15 family glucan-1,4-alpha-glucosidase